MSSLSQFIVGKEKNNFKTIQSAIYAANENGGGVVYIQPGIYAENLQLFDRVDLCGAVGIADTQTCVIVGTHDLALQGDISIRNICLKSVNSIFSNQEVGETSLFLNSCFVSVEDGYVFNLPNWQAPGKLVGFDIGDAGSVNNGVVNNYGGAPVLFVAATIGSGRKNSMRVSGSTNFFTVELKCPLSFLKNLSNSLNSGCCFRDTVTFMDSSSVRISNSIFISGEEPSIIYNSKGSSSISDSTIDTICDVAIDGTGPGLLKAGSITFLNSSKVTETCNLQGASFLTGDVVITGQGKGLLLPEGDNAKMGVVKLISGEGLVLTKSVTKKSRVFLTPQSEEGIPGFVRVKVIEEGNSFTIKSSNKEDKSLVAWVIIDSN